MANTLYQSQQLNKIRAWKQRQVMNQIWRRIDYLIAQIISLGRLRIRRDYSIAKITAMNRLFRCTGPLPVHFIRFLELAFTHLSFLHFLQINVGAAASTITVFPQNVQEYKPAESIFTSLSGNCPGSIGRPGLTSSSG